MKAEHRPLQRAAFCRCCKTTLAKGTKVFVMYNWKDNTILCKPCVTDMAAHLDDGPVSQLRDAALTMANEYKQLADSGDAGFWKAEAQPEYLALVSAIDDLNALQETQHEG